MHAPTPDSDRRRVSVALCTYNGASYLPDLLSSLVDQKRQPDELVVCDDRSTDESVAIVQRFAGDSPFPVSLHLGDVQRGVTETFDQAIALCSGELIALCDQDDVWLPEKLERAVSAFDDQPHIGFTFSNAELVDDQLRPLGRDLWDAVGFSSQFREQAAAGDLLPLLIPFTFVTGATVTFRADLRAVLLPLPHDWHHDAWIAIAAALLRPYAMLDEKLLLYRLHDEQAIGVPQRSVKDLSRIRWRESVSPGKIDLHRQRRRVEARRLRELIERYEGAGKRHLEKMGIPATERAAAMLGDIELRAHHAGARGSLPDRRIKRVPAIIEELRGGRYRRFSAGYLSALQDLLY